MKLSWEINIGTVCQLCILLFAILGGLRKASSIEQKVVIMYTWFENQIINGNGRNDHSKHKTASGSN